MARQTTTIASRRLKTARDITAEMIRDDLVVEKAKRWIEEGRWEERLAARQCGQTCRDVVRGFEEVCTGWRERIVGWSTAAGAAETLAEMGGGLGPVRGGGGEVEVVAS